MTARSLERLARLSAVDTQFSAESAAHKLTGARPAQQHEASPRHGVDIAELLRRLEADAIWSKADGPALPD